MQRWLVALTLLALAFSAQVLTPVAHGQPTLTETDPEDGDVLDEPPAIVHLCFSQPVEVDDPEDFAFSLLTPEERRLGLRIVFQTDGSCVDIHPGRPPGSTLGTWTFTWQVTARGSGDTGSGGMQFEVTQELFAPEPSPAASTADTDGDGQDILFLALITTGSLAGAALLALILYLVRRRIGFWLHRPPPREGSEPEQH